MASLSSRVWQRPFVNVFKLVNVSLATGKSDPNVEHCGDVKEMLDKSIGALSQYLASSPATLQVLN